MDDGIAMKRSELFSGGDSDDENDVVYDDENEQGGGVVGYGDEDGESSYDEQQPSSPREDNDFDDDEDDEEFHLRQNFPNTGMSLSTLDTKQPETVVRVPKATHAVNPPRFKREDIFIEGADRRTRPIMSTFEYTALIGERATLIEQGATNIDPIVIEKIKKHGLDKSLDIAEVEIETLEADFPLTIHRQLGPNVFEVWKARELRLPSQILCESYSPEATLAMLGEYGTKRCPGDVAGSLNILSKFAL